MPTLKDYLSTDIHNTFFNEKEFSETVLLDGQEVLVMVDDDQLQKQNLQKGEGLTADELLFYVNKDEVTEGFFLDKTIKFNKESYKITQLTENIGVYTVSCVGIRSGGYR